MSVEKTKLIESNIKKYTDSKRRLVINKNTGKFGFVHRVDGDLFEVYYPYPDNDIVEGNFEDFDCCVLDGKEFKYS